MPNSAQWFLDVQYWGGLGEVIPFTDYREARQRCLELGKIAHHGCPSFLDDHSEEDLYAGVLPSGFALMVHCAELSDEDGYRVSGHGADYADRVDDLVDARLANVLPFVIGKYRTKWLDGGNDFTRVAGWPPEVVEFQHA